MVKDATDVFTLTKVVHSIWALSNFTLGELCGIHSVVELSCVLSPRPTSRFQERAGRFHKESLQKKSWNPHMKFVLQDNWITIPGSFFGNSSKANWLLDGRSSSMARWLVWGLITHNLSQRGKAPGISPAYPGHADLSCLVFSPAYHRLPYLEKRRKYW